MYKLLAFSDLHSDEEALDGLRMLSARENFDAIICAGDITNRGPLSYAKDLINLFDQKFYFVHGNMDTSIVIDELRKHKGYIHGRKLNFLDWNIVGIGGSNPTPFSTPSEMSELQIKELLNDCEPDYNTILVSHAPPKGFFDLVNENSHVGSEAILEVLEKTKPLMLLCGHIHEHFGKKIYNDSLIIKLPAAENKKAAKITISNKIDVEFINL
jgi:Icc-related predicted phosphoesterase